MVENEIVRREYYCLSIGAFIFSLIPIMSLILTCVFMFIDGIPKQIIELGRVINLCIIYLMPFVSIIISIISIIKATKYPEKYRGIWFCIAAILISIGVYIFLLSGIFIARGAHKGPNLLK